ncbi:hypothetical protein BDV96DRAFT_150729 [Lophiotrema nucula]|uniref:Uncharacterized protein n=1 Tax=Lophiotrema nucula TaxID=690887 RepID=A0A6A5Z237_9PLEO|nr:hypothetical protein BDV96DRAFT_150729 [Lophiotrema nucula]
MATAPVLSFMSLHSITLLPTAPASPLLCVFRAAPKLTSSQAVHTPQGSPHQVPIRPRSQPFEPPYPTPATQRPQTYIATHTPSSHLQVTIDSGDELGSKGMHQRSSQSTQANFANQTPHIIHSPMPPQESHMILEGPMTQDPVQHGHLQLPMLRTRSSSQPQPLNMKGWGAADPKGLIMTPISPGQESLRPHSYYGHSAMSAYSTPSPTMRHVEEPLSPMPLRVSMTS